MPMSYHTQRRLPRSPWRKRLFWGGLFLLALVVALGVVLLGTSDKPLPTTVVSDSSPLPTRGVILYFAAPDGQTLVAETRTINDCQQSEDCLRETVQALIAGSEGALAAILPDQTVLRNLAVQESLVTLDFSQELVTAHPGGTQSELLTIYGLTDTLAVNFPHLRQVQFLIEGAAVPTLKGHVDLRQPISPDFSLVEEGQSPTGKLSTLPVGGDE